MHLIRERIGVTLIELVTALSVISIIATLSFPLFTSLIQRQRISGTGETLYNRLQFARSEAVKRNISIYVSFQTGDTWCYGLNAGSSCNCNIAGNCSLGTVSYASAQQISFSTNGLNSNSIYFEGSHGAANASGTITLTQYNQSSPLMTITIGRMGGISVCTTDISGYTAC